jgi:hypothetical protein
VHKLRSSPSAVFFTPLLPLFQAVILSVVPKQLNSLLVPGAGYEASCIINAIGAYRIRCRNDRIWKWQLRVGIQDGVYFRWDREIVAYTVCSSYNILHFQTFQWYYTHKKKKRNRLMCERFQFSMEMFEREGKVTIVKTTRSCNI